MRSCLLLLLVCFAMTDRVVAQAPDRLRATVTALSHDSTAGRKTPSTELDKAARYLENKFRSIGARPLGNNGTFLHQYPIIESVLDLDSAHIKVGDQVRWGFGQDYFYAAGGGGDPRGVIRAQLSVVTGTVTRENAESLGLSDRIVVFLSPLSARGAPEDFRSAFAIGGSGALAVILPGGRPDSLWRRLSADPDEHKPSAEPAWPLGTRMTPDSVVHIGFRPVLELWNGRWPQFIEAAHIDTARLRVASGPPKATHLPQTVTLDFARRVQRVSWPSNVVGVIQGSDPVLRNEYVLLTAHYDGLGMAKGRPPGPQSILNGADDNSSGVAALLEVAARVARAPTKRSVVFAAVSGEENGLWGSDHLARQPPVPVNQIVANINMDMIGRPGGDTVYVTGRGNQTIGAIANRVVGRNSHRLTILGETELESKYPGQRADERSDHASFRERGVPSIWFFTGWHADYHETTDDADKVNYAALSRITDLIHNVSVEIANTLRPLALQ